jgi:two-component system, response regulator
MLSNSQPILLVEDTPEDAEATLRAFKKAGMANPIFHCTDGDDALDYLRQQGKYADPAKAPRPGMILLDLNMPGTDGREVLSEIKADEKLCQIPVIVLTTSADERDIQSCYRDGANSYIQKPVDMKGFLESIQRLVDYWYHIVLLPKTAR